jgi:hypothetical protein
MMRDVGWVVIKDVRINNPSPFFLAVKGTVDAAAEFQTYHAVFVLQYN